MSDTDPPNSSQQPNDSPSGSPDTPLSRRTLLIGGASATAAAIAGLAAGIGVGAHEVPPAPRNVASRRRFTLPEPQEEADSEEEVPTAEDGE